MPRLGEYTLLLALVVSAIACASASAQVSPGRLTRTHAFLEGLRKCTTCHDLRTQSMDAKCLECHTEISWLVDQNRGLHAAQTASCDECHHEHGGRDLSLVHWGDGGFQAFDHGQAGWVLDGSHSETDCRECHQPLHQSDHLGTTEWKPSVDSWLGLAPACAGCHENPHSASLQSQCANCHKTTSFDDISMERFDHDLTKYALVGAHVTVECAACHEPNGVRVWQPETGSCSSCHDDPHAGTALLAGNAVDCAACHDVHTFQPSTFSRSDHAQTDYPLRGAHTQVTCRGCHATLKSRYGTAGFRFEPPSGRCTDCHADAHGKQFARRSDHGACNVCHTEDRFSPSTFTVALHDETAFPLDGAHRISDCRDCHGPGRRDLPTIADTPSLGDAGVAFFPGRTCNACHFDAHAGRFTSGDSPARGACESCHGTVRFSTVAVGRDEHARWGFALDGAHAAVSCAECHDELERRQASSTLLASASAHDSFTFETPNRCFECHDDPHGTQFVDTSCAACHGTESFVPATSFDHTRDTQFALEGDHASSECAACHVSGPRPDGSRGTLFRGVDRACVDCHSPEGKS